MSEPITYWKWTRDGMVVAACPELQDGLYVIRERYDALQAKVRELEEQLRVATAINHAFKQSEENLEAKLHTQQDRVRELEERLATREKIYLGDQARILDLEAKLWQVEQERDRLRARVCELEEALQASRIREGVVWDESQ